MRAALHRARALLAAFGTRPHPGLAALLLGLVADVEGPVVLLLDGRGRNSLGPWIGAFGTDRLVVLAEPGTPVHSSVRWVEVSGRRELDNQLTFLGSCAVIVDEVAADPSKQLARWAQFGLHVQLGGQYVVRATSRPEKWRSLVDDLGDDVDKWTRRTLKESSEDLRIDFGHLLLPQKRRQVLRVNERTVDAVLPLRTPDLSITTIASRPAVLVDTTMQFFNHAADGVFIPSAPFEAPPLTCRWYRGTVEARAHLLTMHGSTALPPSFRHAWAGRSHSVELRDFGKRFGEWLRVPPAPQLAGDYYDLNAGLPGHFGHVMTESVSKLWAWEEARATVPGLKGLYRLPDGAASPTFEADLFEAYGISRDEIHWATSDVTLESYISPTVPWHNSRPYHFHPDVRNVWQRLRTALVVPGKDTPERIFVSRGNNERGCRNQAEVESWFADRGFAVVYPERLSLAEQATLFANARVVAGFAGSALFNLLFSSGLDRLIVLTHKQYLARNEWLFGVASADELHYFWAEPDVVAGPGVSREAAFHSSWAFDFEALSAELEHAAR